MIKSDYEDIAAVIYDQTADLIEESLIDYLYDQRLITETNDAAMQIRDKVLKQFYARHLTKTW